MLIGVSTGHATQTGKCLWVEKEYYWNSKATGRQKTNSEYARDVEEFLEPYGPRCVYIDPSAASMRLELQRKGIPVVSADNDVTEGIREMTSQMAEGNLFVLDCCPNLIKEIEGYVWDSKKSIEGEDAPVKRGDHAVDALRYCMQSHKVVTYNPYTHNPNQYIQNRFSR